ncbi:heavy metal sensor histidine kinase [Dyella nitratireducens]|uniref:Sensor protein n=1 Tax=Dyella nitratireducens TaxID=1849580 RepID=A0ABQ1GIM1_9GAMM|nr:heavy metal sensor histidine kinase [Dyella nitratireducens]GGA44391.1 two-component sensor histidine kinase [Dyella nitratireducens]GLQ41749.1 two-component sensor histidine kinase [Dyella nitratireducens]
MRLSLTARLTITFVVITVACFSVVGLLLFKEVSRRIYIHDQTNIMLDARHLRRLAEELQSPDDLLAHKDRLIALVLGDNANGLRVLGRNGQVLIDHVPMGYMLSTQPVVPADQRIVPDSIQSWKDNNGNEIRGVATAATLKDGESVTIAMARSLADRTALLNKYRSDVLLSLLTGLLVAVLLSFLLVRRALRPLRAMAESASAITAQRLSTRMPLQHAPTELLALAASLNDMLARLEQGFARVWQFTVDLAHDLRTPIGNLRGANEVALNRHRSLAEYEALLGSNIEECDRVSRTIESVLFLARAESPQFAMQRVELDTALELQRIADYFEGLSADAGVAIEVEASATVRADRDLFRRAVNNLLSNALRYTPSGETIHLRAVNTGKGVEVSVENPGRPIDPEHLDKLFDRFYRVDRSRSDSATSTGLGLSIVKSIMELHGGAVSVQSSGSLTRFTLHFPQT